MKISHALSEAMRLSTIAQDIEERFREAVRSGLHSCEELEQMQRRVTAAKAAAEGARRSAGGRKGRRR